MNKIEELIERIRNNDGHYASQDFTDVDIESIMIEYAEYYAKQLWNDILDASYYTDDGILVFQPTSLTLPEHA